MQKVKEHLTVKLEVEKVDTNDVDQLFTLKQTSFDLEKAPLFHISLLSLPNGKALLILDVHHIIFDGASLNNFIKELSSLYDEKTLPDLTISYQDYSIWEEEQLKQNGFKNSKKYWLNQFQDEIPILNLPTSYVRPSKQCFEGAKIHQTVSKELFDHVQSLAQNFNSSNYMFLLATYYILLFKYANQEEIIVGTPVIGRNKEELLPMIGMFVNSLPLRIHIDSSISFVDFLEQVKIICSEAMTNQAYPFDDLVSTLNITRDTSRNPVFDTMFTYQSEKISAIRFGTIQGHYYAPDTNTSKFDLSLEVTPLQDELDLNFEYCKKLFSDHFMENLSEHYLHILQVVTQNPDVKICDIDMLSKVEKNKITNDFNHSFLKYPDESSLVSLFQKIVAKHPNKTSVEFSTNSITYKELDQKSNTLALELQKNGIQKGDVIGVYMNRSIELLIAIWAILKSGAVYMPMYVGYPKDRLSYMVKDSNCRLLIVNSNTENTIHVSCKTVTITSFDAIKNTKHFDLSDHILPTDLAYIIYTSGSTGKPKGVSIMHKNLVNYVFAFDHLFGGISPKDRFLSSTNISFDVSIWEFFLSILNGATLVLHTEEIISNILEYTRNIIESNITTLYIPPNILEEVYSLMKNTKNLKLGKILVGVEPIKKRVLNQFYLLNPHMKIINGYGPTETTICSTALVYQKGEDNDDIVPIGKPIANTNIYIVDPHMQILPIGVPGELCISGDGVGKGYLNNLEETASHFVENPFDYSSKLYKTGDIAKWNADGTISYIGRKDHQVKFSGYRIELKEIDHNIASYPSITKSLTTVYQNDKKSYLITYFTANKKVSTSDLSSFLQTKLASYMVPTIYMQLENFPLTVNGKIDQKNLPTPDLSPKQNYVAASTELEKKLCAIWKDLFGLKKIGIEDNFFDLGGDSLSAIKFQVEALSQNINIAYSDIFSFPTIKQLANKTDNDTPLLKDNKNYDYSKINELLSLNDIKYLPKHIKSRQVKRVLLTGATGFLGAHILDNYLSTTRTGIVYCFVRRKNLENPEERLQKTLEFYFGKKYNKSFGKRIKVIVADITLDNFGLSTSDYTNLAKKIDVVINSAAIVKHYGEYHDFYSINVLGTQKLIDFCKKYHKKLYHISTTSVSGMGLPENNLEKATFITHFDERDLFRNQNLNNNYIETKFEAERLILENITSGLDACIFRMGNISNRYSDGKFQINVSENAFVNRVKSILKLQVLQEGFQKHATEFAPVDLCAEAIIKIIKSNPEFSVFHIFNNYLTSFKDMIQYMKKCNIEIQLVSDKEFASTVKKFLRDPNLRNQISGIVSDLNTEKIFILNANILLDCNFTVSYLDKVGFKWSKIDQDYIQKYIEYFRTIHYFD